MKNLIKLSLLFSIILSSCNNDDNRASYNQSSDVEKEIIGKWIPYEIIVNGNSKEYDGHESCGSDYLQFHKDLTYNHIDFLNCNENIENGTYTIDNKTKKLVVKNGNTSREGTARIFSSPEKILSIEYTYDYDGDGKDDNVTTLYNFDKTN